MVFILNQFKQRIMQTMTQLGIQLSEVCFKRAHTTPVSDEAKGFRSGQNVSLML